MNIIYIFIFAHIGLNICHSFFFPFFITFERLYNREISLAVLLRQLAK